MMIDDNIHILQSTALSPPHDRKQMQSTAPRIKPPAHHISLTYGTVAVSPCASVSQTSCSQHRESPSFGTGHMVSRCARMILSLSYCMASYPAAPFSPHSPTTDVHCLQDAPKDDQLPASGDGCTGMLRLTRSKTAIVV